ncbi:OmpP1/FadL family transporter [Vibrio crassostreae]|uniref:OmpP1/FadL family transporter n=1 Tax=Vibrio crassostreae TaxID=246167 RepID=UPI001B30B95B|nr:outer membrane protein transport protein [Vibrio crassostreae]
MNKPTKVALACVIALGSNSAFAAAHMLSDLGANNASTAGAGSAALAETALTAWTNPAGMANLNEEAMTFNIAALGLDIQYKDTGSTGAFANGTDGDNAGSVMPVGSFYYAKPLNEKWHMGFSVASQGGSGLDYGSDFRGAPLVQSVDLVTVQVAPSVSYKVDDKLSFGAMINIEKASINQKMMGGVEIEADDVTVGYTLSSMYRFDENDRIGVVYRSEIDHSNEGELTNAGMQAEASVGLIMPRSLTISGYHKRDASAFLYSLGWADFSSMKSSPMAVDVHSAELKRDYKDTWTAAVGFHHELSKTLRLESGVSYESNPIQSDDTQHPDLPTSELWKLGFGANHQLSDKWEAKYYYEFLKWGDASIDREYVEGSGNTLKGDYENKGHYVGVQFTRRF